MAQVELLDLKRQYGAIQREIEEALLSTARSGRYILGPAVESFEKRIAAYIGVSYAIGCASGSDALLLSLQALRVGEGDEVITTPYTFFSTAGCIRRLGARPVFVDIEPETFNINPDLIPRAVTERTRAIIPVHLFGQCATMEKILDVAKEGSIPVVEDACQAIGASRNGKKAGSFGQAGCFSFFPSKNLGGFGDGGLITTASSELNETLRMLRDHGQKPRYHHQVVGINSRLDALQAAVLEVKLRYLDKWNEKRRDNARYYNERLKDLGLGVPLEAEGNFHTYNQYVVRVPERKLLLERFKRSRVGFGLYYPIPLHLQGCFADLGYKKGDFPEAERAAEETVALPVYPELTRQEQDLIIREIEAHLAKLH